LQKEGSTFQNRLGVTISGSSGWAFNIRFLFLPSAKYFQIAFASGWTFDEFPAFANTRRLTVIVKDRLNNFAIRLVK
jgi:hypothetical protein